MLRHHRGVGGAELSARLLQSCARCKPSKKFGHAMNAAFHHGRGEVVWAGHDIGDDLGIGWIGDGRLEHADDGAAARPHGTAAETHGFAEDAWIAMKCRRPETIGQNDDTVSFRTIVLRADETAEDRVQSHHFKILAVDYARLNLARIAQADHGKADRREIAELTNGAGAGFYILEFRDREVGVLVADP